MVPVAHPHLGACADAPCVGGSIFSCEAHRALALEMGRASLSLHVAIISSKETTMNRPLVYPTLLTLFLGLNHVPLAMAARGTHESAKPRGIATIIALEPRGMATIRAADGT